VSVKQTVTLMDQVEFSMAMSRNIFTVLNGKGEKLGRGP